MPSHCLPSKFRSLHPIPKFSTFYPTLATSFPIPLLNLSQKTSEAVAHKRSIALSFRNYQHWPLRREHIFPHLNCKFYPSFKAHRHCHTSFHEPLTGQSHFSLTRVVQYLYLDDGTCPFLCYAIDFHATHEWLASTVSLHMGLLYCQAVRVHVLSQLLTS